jgi:hypothetical protein
MIDVTPDRFSETSEDFRLPNVFGMKTENLQLIRVVHVDGAGATKTIAKAKLVF